MRATRTKKIKKPEALDLSYVGVQQIFENLEKARKNLAAANRCDDPSDAIYYRDALDALVRLEAQADALTVVFQTPRREIQKWITEMKAYYKALENYCKALEKSTR